MTFIKPHKSISYSFFVISLLGLFLIGGLLYIFQYNSLASARHEIRKIKEDLKETQIANADLKNNLYQTIDPARLEGLASLYNLVFERQPEYLKNNQWAPDSSF